MNQADRQAWDEWAENHVLTRVHFGWGNDGSHELTLEDCTYNYALARAKEWGYQEPRWFKPWTWMNWVVTVG